MIELIPAIDIIEGKCVRLSKGDYDQKKVYNENPLEVAKEFEAEGIRRLHLVDLDGAKAGRIVNYSVLERISTQTNLVIDFGGGLKRDEDLRIAFECGASMITGGSIAVKDRDSFIRWIDQYGSDKIILGADVRNQQIAVSGWLETTDLELDHFLQDYYSHGIRKVISTDIEKDGMLSGPSFELYDHIRQLLPEMYVIASGGVSKIGDIERLNDQGVHAVIFGKALYEGCISWKELRRFIE